MPNLLRTIDSYKAKTLCTLLRCQGDGGGPLTVVEGGAHILAGITSQAIPRSEVKS